MLCTDRFPRLENYILDNDDWKYDVMPEFLDGKNVADFFSADIADQLTKLEAEEEKLDGEGFYESGDDEEVSLDATMDWPRVLTFFDPTAQL